MTDTNVLASEGGKHNTPLIDSQLGSLHFHLYIDIHDTCTFSRIEPSVRQEQPLQFRRDDRQREVT